MEKKELLEKLNSVKKYYEEFITNVERVKRQQNRIADILSKQDEETKHFLGYDEYKLKNDEQIDDYDEKIKDVTSRLKSLKKLIAEVETNDEYAEVALNLIDARRVNF